MANPRTRIVTYLASSFASLDILKTTCERDEGRLGKIIKIEAGVVDKNDGDKATQITYERVILPTDINIGNLIFEPFTDDANANLIHRRHQQTEDTPLIFGNEPRAVAFIGNNTVRFLAYRKKAA